MSILTRNSFGNFESCSETIFNGNNTPMLENNCKGEVRNLFRSLICRLSGSISNSFKTSRNLERKFQFPSNRTYI